jgi:flagellar motility protein MotE (MotC chaperone)
VASEGFEKSFSVGWRSMRWLIAGLLAAKVATLALELAGGTSAAQASSAAEAATTPALAVSRPPTAAAAPGVAARERGGAATAGAGDVKSLLEALARRQAELDERERTLAAREEKLALYEKDVTAKIAQLEQVGKTLKDELRRSNAASDEAAQSLAKVYGAMKPTEAAPILDQLDEATTLRILSRMKEKQVGEILPFMKRDRAVVLTRSLAGQGAAPGDAAPRPHG